MVYREEPITIRATRRKRAAFLLCRRASSAMSRCNGVSSPASYAFRQRSTQAAVSHGLTLSGRADSDHLEGRLRRGGGKARSSISIASRVEDEVAGGAVVAHVLTLNEAFGIATTRGSRSSPRDGDLAGRRAEALRDRAKRGMAQERRPRRAANRPSRERRAARTRAGGRTRCRAARGCRAPGSRRRRAAGHRDELSQVGDVEVRDAPARGSCPRPPAARGSRRSPRAARARASAAGRDRCARSPSARSDASQAAVSFAREAWCG